MNQRGRKGIHDLVELLTHVFRQQSRNKVSVLLEQHIFPTGEGARDFTARPHDKARARRLMAFRDRIAGRPPAGRKRAERGL
jgi:hypothetical protein